MVVTPHLLLLVRARGKKREGLLCDGIYTKSKKILSMCMASSYTSPRPWLRQSNSTCIIGKETNYKEISTRSAEQILLAQNVAGPRPAYILDSLPSDLAGGCRRTRPCRSKLALNNLAGRGVSDIPPARRWPAGCRPCCRSSA